MIDVWQILVSLLLFVSVFLLIWSLFSFPVPADTPVHRRVAMALGAENRQTVFENPTLKPIMNLGLSLSSRIGFPAMRNFLRRNLDAAGNPNNYSVDEFLSICLICGAGFGLVTGLMVMLVVGTLEPMVVVIMAPIGFAAPIWSLRESARARVNRISKQLPYTLDLVALMMGAGATFTEAVNTVIRDNPDDDFNQELRIVQAEIELGTSRAIALANMAQRIPLDTLRSIIGAVNQSESLGTPLSTILMTQSDMLRTYRSVRAEKLSASASLRIMVPMMLILIATVLLLFGPLIIRWQQGDFS